MSNCPICGRHTRIINKKKIMSGKNKGMTLIQHHCEKHGIFKTKIRKPLKGEIE